MLPIMRASVGTFEQDAPITRTARAHARMLPVPVHYAHHAWISVKVWFRKTVAHNLLLPDDNEMFPLVVYTSSQFSVRRDCLKRVCHGDTTPARESRLQPVPATHRLKPGLRGRCPVAPGNQHAV